MRLEDAITLATKGVEPSVAEQWKKMVLQLVREYNLSRKGWLYVGGNDVRY